MHAATRPDKSILGLRSFEWNTSIRVLATCVAKWGKAKLVYMKRKIKWIEILC